MMAKLLEPVLEEAPVPRRAPAKKKKKKKATAPSEEEESEDAAPPEEEESGNADDNCDDNDEEASDDDEPMDEEGMAIPSPSWGLKRGRDGEASSSTAKTEGEEQPGPPRIREPVGGSKAPPLLAVPLAVVKPLRKRNIAVQGR